MRGDKGGRDGERERIGSGGGLEEGRYKSQEPLESLKWLLVVVVVLVVYVVS